MMLDEFRQVNSSWIIFVPVFVYETISKLLKFKICCYHYSWIIFLQIACTKLRFWWPQLTQLNFIIVKLCLQNPTPRKQWPGLHLLAYIAEWLSCPWERKNFVCTFHVTFFWGRKTEMLNQFSSFNNSFQLWLGPELSLWLFPSKQKIDGCKYIVTFNENLFERNKILPLWERIYTCLMPQISVFILRHQWQMWGG
jgi:hypothetical protein